MDIRKISDTLSVSPQIAATDVQAIADAGFRSIICNRPDGEVEDQPRYDDVAQVAVELGLKVKSIPFTAGHMTMQDVVEFSEAVSSLPAPVLAYCRSGTRCAIIWSYSQLDKQDRGQILAATLAAGYDLDRYLPPSG